MSRPTAKAQLSLDEPPPEAPEAVPQAESSFEESLERLNRIVEELETGELPLEQSLTLFEEGVRLARASQAWLDKAERRVEELLAVDDNGDPVTRDMDVE